jgi:hypothetical protein
MSEKIIAEIALMILGGRDPIKIPAYRAASLRDRRRIDDKVREFKQLTTLEAEKQEEIELLRSTRNLDEPPQPKF